MAVKTVGVLGNLSPDTERGPSPSIWNAQGSNNGWIADFIQDPRLGILTWEDFTNCGISPATGSALNFDADKAWYAYLDSNGAITDSAIVGGGIHLAASTTAHQGVALSSLTTTYQLITSGAAVQGRLYFECRLQASAANYANSTSDIFVGLVDDSGTPASAVPITNTGGTLSTAPGLIGFHKRGGTTSATDFAFVFNVAGGTPQYFTQLNTLITTITGTAPAGATFYKLGFVFNPQAEPLLISSANALTGETANILSVPYVTIYVNGQPAAAIITKTLVTGATFPTTVMAPAIAFKQQSTTASVNCDVDWIAVAQEMIA